MRLLNTSTIQLEEFLGEPPPYAILSHTWEDDEVLFADIQGEYPIHKKGYEKVRRCCELANSEGHDFVWIDTCCIDKSSSTELSEAINSMFAYYQNAEICYVFLDIEVSGGTDESGLLVPKVEDLRKARWMYRGWTLQELIAPSDVNFCDRRWRQIGNRESLADNLAQITNIHPKILSRASAQSADFLATCSIAERMSWASKRQTTRAEDIAYCLFGIFGVHLPLMYGEGAGNAFLRLQEEIIKTSTDLSILAWSNDHLDIAEDLNLLSGVFARSPRMFAQGSLIAVAPEVDVEPFRMTNKGLRMKLPIVEDQMNKTGFSLFRTAILPNCWFTNDPTKSPIGVRLSAFSTGSGDPVWYRKIYGGASLLRFQAVCPVDRASFQSDKLFKMYIGVTYRVRAASRNGVVPPSVFDPNAIITKRRQDQDTKNDDWMWKKPRKG